MNLVYECSQSQCPLNGQYITYFLSTGHCHSRALPFDGVHPQESYQLDTSERHASSLEYVLVHRSCCLVCINLNSIPLCSLLQMYAKEASILTAYNSAFGEQLKPLTTNCGDSVWSSVLVHVTTFTQWSHYCYMLDVGLGQCFRY